MDSSQSSVKSSSTNPLQPVLDSMQGVDADAICEKYGITRAELEKRIHSYQESRRQMALADQFTPAKVGRNEPCPCGSGKKYKKCCLASHEEARKSIPADALREMEERERLRERLEKEVQRGFDLLFSQDYSKAHQFAQRLLQTYPEDDRLHDIVVTALMVKGDYDDAFHVCRRRWQVAQEEKDFFQENDYHKREGADRKELVYFYPPSIWMGKFWIAQRARHYREEYPVGDDARLMTLVKNLKTANDIERFPAKQEEGYEVRRQALASVLSQIEEAGPAAIPYLLPLIYSFSWVSLFVPDILSAYGNSESVRLLAELSMFRFPSFTQKCLMNLVKFDGLAVTQIEKIMEENPAFDELKVGLIAVLGNIKTDESFAILTKMIEHQNPYVVNCAAEALSRHQNPEARPYLEKAKERLGALSKISDAMKDLAGMKNV